MLAFPNHEIKKSIVRSGGGDNFVMNIFFGRDSVGGSSYGESGNHVPKRLALSTQKGATDQQMWIQKLRLGVVGEVE